MPPGVECMNRVMDPIAPNSLAPTHPANAEAGPPIPALGTSPAWNYVWLTLLALGGFGCVLAQWLRPETNHGLFLPVLALLACLLAAFYDAATSHIPNSITYTGILLGLTLNSVPLPWLGPVGSSQAFLGFALCAGLGIVCLITGGMGLGDVKLMVALGALLGYSQVGEVLIWALLIAAPYGVVNLLVAGRLNGVLRTAALQSLQIACLGKFDPVEPPSRTLVPLAVPLFAALLCTRLLPEGWLMQFIQ